MVCCLFVSGFILSWPGHTEQNCYSGRILLSLVPGLRRRILQLLTCPRLKPRPSQAWDFHKKSESFRSIFVTVLLEMLREKSKCLPGFYFDGVPSKLQFNVKVITVRKTSQIYGIAPKQEALQTVFSLKAKSFEKI